MFHGGENRFIKRTLCKMNPILLIIITLLLVASSFSVLSQDNTRYPFSSNTHEFTKTPSDRIIRDNIHVFSDKAVIEKENLIWAKVEDTHSMEPTLNSNTITLELKPVNEKDVKIGDIISYQSGSIIIIHRVVELDNDESGWFAITKGDNNKDNDNYKVRFNSIKGIVVGILY